MLVGKALRYQQLSLVDSLVVGHKVVVVNEKTKLETIYDISDSVLLVRIQNRLRREIIVFKNYIKLYEEPDNYILDTIIKTDRQNTEQVI